MLHTCRLLERSPGLSVAHEVAHEHDESEVAGLEAMECVMLHRVCWVQCNRGAWQQWED